MAKPARDFTPAKCHCTAGIHSETGMGEMREKTNADRMADRLKARDETDKREGVVRPPTKPMGETAAVTINSVPREVVVELQQLAYRSKTSVSQLGLMAVKLLLELDRSGTLPPIPPAPSIDDVWHQ